MIFIYLSNIYFHGFLEGWWRHKLYYLLIYILSNGFSQIPTFVCICEYGDDSILLADIGKSVLERI